MKTLKNLAMTALIGGLTIFSNPSKVYSQISEKPKQENQGTNLNFYFETGEDIDYVDMPPFKKDIKAWLCACPKDESVGNIWLNYGDTDGDGVYDYVNIQNSNNIYPIRYQEKFLFNFDTKKIDYFLDIYDYCQEPINNCDKIIAKSYNGIEQKEAESLGGDFFERIKEFAKTQKEFNRFNSGQLEELIRKEYAYQLKMNNGKLVGNSRIPIEKFLSKEEIKKVENYVIEKPERERIKKEQEEKLKELKRQQDENRIEYEKQEKIRIEQEKIMAEQEKIKKEARKIEHEKQDKIRIEQEKIIAEQEKIIAEQKKARQPKARLKVGGSIGNAYDVEGNFERNYGSSFFEINSLIEYGIKPKYGGKEIKHKIGLDLVYGSLQFKDYGNKLEYSTSGIGLNFGIISPSSKIEYDYLKIKLYLNELSLSLSQKLEFFPFRDYFKDLSLSLEAGILSGDTTGINLEGKFGIMYTLGK